jgi:hypothetical protein
MVKFDLLVNSVQTYLNTTEGKTAMQINLMLFGRSCRVKNEVSGEYGATTCLKQAFNLASQFGVGDHRHTVFLNSLGANIRKALMLRDHGFKVQSKVLCETMLLLTLDLFHKESVIYKATTKLQVHRGLYEAVLQYSCWLSTLQKLDADSM